MRAQLLYSSVIVREIASDYLLLKKNPKLSKRRQAVLFRRLKNLLESGVLFEAKKEGKLFRRLKNCSKI